MMSSHPFVVASCNQWATERMADCTHLQQRNKRKADVVKVGLGGVPCRARRVETRLLVCNNSCIIDPHLLVHASREPSTKQLYSQNANHISNDTDTRMLADLKMSQNSSRISPTFISPGTERNNAVITLRSASTRDNRRSGRRHRSVLIARRAMVSLLVTTSPVA